MKNIAYLKETSPFYDLFPGGRVPIKSMCFPSRAELAGIGEQEVYMVDLDALTREALTKVATRLATLAAEAPAVAFEEIQKRGLPLRVSETTGCSTDVPWFL